MAALVHERSRRQKDKRRALGEGGESFSRSTKDHINGSVKRGADDEIFSLVESVKRKSHIHAGKHDAKRRKV